MTWAAYPQNTRNINWDADLDYLARELPAKHFNLFALKREADWVSGLDKIRSEKESLTDFEIAVKVQQLIAAFGDSHTQIGMGAMVDMERILPLQLYWYADGLFIMGTTPQNAAILGNRIVSVNATPLETVVDSLSTLITVDNQAMLMKSVPAYLCLSQLLGFFGFADSDRVELGLKDRDGNATTYVIEPAPLSELGNIVGVKADSVAFCNTNRNALFAEGYITRDKIYYLQYNRCWNRELESQYGNKDKEGELPSFREFEDKVLRTLKSEPVDKIIFDMRYNGGGSSAQGTRFIEKLAAYLDGNPGIELYVVVGRDTFSSAILNAMDFKKLTRAILVGEQTSGKPNHFGEVRGFRLPASGLNVGYSTKYFRNTEEDMDALTPDVLIEAYFASYTSGEDPVYQWISRQ